MHLHCLQSHLQRHCKAAKAGKGKILSTAAIMHTMLPSAELETVAGADAAPAAQLSLTACGGLGREHAAHLPATRDDALAEEGRYSSTSSSRLCQHGTRSSSAVQVGAPGSACSGSGACLSSTWGALAGRVLILYGLAAPAKTFE